MGLLEAAEPFGPREAPEPGHLRDDQEPLDRWNASELFGPRDAPEPARLRDDQEPLDRWDASELFVPPNPSEPTGNLTPERATLPKIPANDAPALTLGARRHGIRVAAIAVASFVVLLVGSGIGVLLAGWQMELPSLRTWTATTPPPGTGSEAAPTAPQEPPPITETVRIERPPLPPGATAERTPSGSSATNPPLPAPRKPALGSSAPGDASSVSEEVDQAVDTLLREAGGPGAP